MLVSCEALDWTAISALANIAMAIATFAAVIVSLWMGVIQTKPRIRLRFATAHIMESVSGRIVDRVIVLEVLNGGNVDIVVGSWGMVFGRRQYMQVAGHLVDPADPLYASLPKRVAPGDEISLRMPSGDLREALLMYMEEGQAKLGDRLELYVCYGGGKIKKIKSKETIGDLLAFMGDGDNVP